MLRETRPRRTASSSAPTDDEVDLVHRLRRDRGAAVARVEQRLVEHFEVVGTQPPQPDPTDRRDDVVLDVAAVPVVGRDSEHDSLAR